MKKILALVLALMMVFSIVGCAKEEAPAAAPAVSYASGSMGDFESIEDDDDSLPF